MCLIHKSWKKHQVRPMDSKNTSETRSDHRFSTCLSLLVLERKQVTGFIPTIHNDEKCGEIQANQLNRKSGDDSCLDLENLNPQHEQFWYLWRFKPTFFPTNDWNLGSTRIQQRIRSSEWRFRTENTIKEFD